MTNYLMKTREISISVIVCTRNRKDYLTRFLQSLESQTLLPDELVIVDASDNTQTRELIKKKEALSRYRIKYITAKPGLTRQRNIGIRESSGKYVCFFDDDVVLEKGFIEVVCGTFKRFKGLNVGGIMGRIVNISSSTKAWERLFKRIFFLSDIGQGRVKLSSLPSVRMDDELSFVESLAGCCMAYLREVFDQFKFDENLKGYAYLEDVDFSYRVGLKYRLLYQPKAKLKHFPSTYLVSDSRELKKMLVRHQAYLFRKNIPKDLPHYFGYWISIIGIFFYNGLVRRDVRACKGIIEGLSEPLVC